MSDYNADPNPSTNLIHQVAFAYRFAPQTKVKADQFSTGGTNKVYTLTKKIGTTRLKILVDPAKLPA